MQPSVYRVPENLPPHLVKLLSTRFRAAPGDEFFRYDEAPRFTLQRDYDGAAARELDALLPHLIHVSGPNPLTSAASARPRPSRASYLRLQRDG